MGKLWEFGGVNNGSVKSVGLGDIREAQGALEAGWYLQSEPFIPSLPSTLPGSHEDMEIPLHPIPPLEEMLYKHFCVLLF